MTLVNDRKVNREIFSDPLISSAYFGRDFTEHNTGLWLLFVDASGTRHPGFVLFDSLGEPLDFWSMSYSVNSRTLVRHSAGIDVCWFVF